ncbi:MAG: MBL fold metallo-hydrolase [Rhodospirillaceae bacterium]|jgi:glyoxylase-like metal-dependent hydrolase (beta-lactamase superfamily II)|nr:MBL fold metallo-hydrolase [Rhodospirillaceae bacterium]MBT7268582.1 MBL fold metallo-hydrolase [Rhodospirillaceae bacterium]
MTKAVTWDAKTDSCDVGSTSIRRVVDLESLPFAANMIYPDAVPSELQELSSRFGAQHFDQNSFDLLLSFHAFLVRNGKHTILVDLCCGNDKDRPTRPAWHMRNGPFLDNLAKAGVQPTDIDFVMCTHLHADHVGWNTQLIDGAWVPTFPKAQYLFAEKEFTHWQREHEKNPPEPVLYGSYLDSVLPVIDSGQAQLVKSNHQVDNGIHMEAAYGHTPGNVIIHVEDTDGHAILCGDAIHHPIQLAHPEWSTNFCTDPVQSRETRMAFLNDYADTQTAILPAHFQAPDYGRIEQDGKSYRLAGH